MATTSLFICTFYFSSWISHTEPLIVLSTPRPPTFLRAYRSSYDLPFRFLLNTFTSTHFCSYSQEFDSFDQGTRVDETVRRNSLSRNVSTEAPPPVDKMGRGSFINFKFSVGSRAVGNYPTRVGHLQAVVLLMIRFKYGRGGRSLFEMDLILAERLKLGREILRCFTICMLSIQRVSFLFILHSDVVYCEIFL